MSQCKLLPTPNDNKPNLSNDPQPGTSFNELGSQSFDVLDRLNKIRQEISDLKYRLGNEKANLAHERLQTASLCSHQSNLDFSEALCYYMSQAFASISIQSPWSGQEACQQVKTMPSCSLYNCFPENLTTHLKDVEDMCSKEIVNIKDSIRKLRRIKSNLNFYINAYYADNLSTSRDVASFSDENVEIGRLKHRFKLPTRDKECFRKQFCRMSPEEPITLDKPRSHSYCDRRIRRRRQRIKHSNNRQIKCDCNSNDDSSDDSLHTLCCYEKSYDFPY